MEKLPDIIIAIDGYSSTGKSSFARRIAGELGFLYLDSGALYRAVTLHAQEHGLIDGQGHIDEEALTAELATLDVHFESKDGESRTYIGGRCVENEIRTLKVSSGVSPISAVPQVRDYVDRKLREFGKERRLVMDGRDIGTTVFPDAELKIFMTADDNVRARRRYDEMCAKGQSPVFEDVLANLRERDHIDSHRSVSPLQKAPDAVILDNSHMSIDDQMDWIKSLLKSRYS